MSFVVNVMTETRHRARTNTRDISRSALCCHSNEIRAPTANLPNSAQVGGTPYHSPNLRPGPYSSVGMRPRTDTQTRVTNVHFASSAIQAKCNQLGPFRHVAKYTNVTHTRAHAHTHTQRERELPPQHGDRTVSTD